MSNQRFLERAFQLAESGTVENVTAIREALVRQGYTHKETAQLGGTTLSKQLMARIAAAKPVP
jgi:hypothetical protein